MAELEGQGPTRLNQVAMRMFGTQAAQRMKNHPQLPTKLAQAAVELVPTAYLATVYLRTVLAAAGAFVVFLLFLLVSGGVGQADPRMLLAFFSSIFLVAWVTYSYAMLWPDLRIGARRRSIDSNLPYALNFLAALASAGIIPSEVFGALGRQSVYGDVSRECGMLYRDTRLFGADLIKALRDAARRSPSAQLAEFFQGAISTTTSGGDLKTYILSKAEHFAEENHRKHRAFVENMGVMAESYVVVAAAAPLFLIVILSVMLLLSGTSDPTFLLNIVVLLAMPVIHAVFVFVLRTMRPE